MYRTKSGHPIIELCERVPLSAKTLTELSASGPVETRTVTIVLDDRTPPQRCTVVATPQRIGRRWWWQCPDCRRRCTYLVSERVSYRYTCRRCLRAVYLSDYPAMESSRMLLQLVGRLPGPFAHDDEIARLAAPRRRGVRRGRRLKRKLARLLARTVDLEPFARLVTGERRGRKV